MSKGNAGLLALCILLAGAAFTTLFVAPRYLGSEPSASPEKTVAAASVTGNGSEEGEAGESADAVGTADREAVPDATTEGEAAAEGETDIAALDSGAEAVASGEDGDAETSQPDAAGEETEEAAEPAFDVLRVEPDGSTVIAGRAAPGSRLEILDGEKVVATADVNDSGDFAVVFDKPLSAGDHELRLRATTADGDETVSDEVATVSVPTEKDGELLAMITEPGAASRIMTAPQSEKGNRPGAGNSTDDTAMDRNEQGATSDDGETSMSGGNAMADEGEVADAPSAPAEIAALDGAGETETAPEETEQPEIHIDAVEVEGDALYVTGSARPNTTVRIYAGDRAAGEDDVGEEGRFLVEESLALAVGEHEIRADMIEDGEVIARAIVPFFRPQEDAAAAVADLDMAGGDDAGTVIAEEGGDASVETAANESRPAARPSAPTADAPASASIGDTGETAASTVDDAGAASGTEMAATEGDSVATFRQAPLEPSEASVIIRRGDTLWQISRRVYGQGVRYTTIYLANSDQIANPDLILPGQVFALPEEALANSAELHRERMSSD